MALFDRQFEVIQPELDRLARKAVEVADLTLLNPQNTLSIIPGELVFVDTTYKWVRATTATIPSFFTISDRGDYTNQATRKLSAIIGGGAYECDTIVFNTGLTSLGAPVQLGTVNNSLSGSVNRSGLIASAGGLVLGYVMRTAANNNGRLRILQTLV